MQYLTEQKYRYSDIWKHTLVLPAFVAQLLLLLAARWSVGQVNLHHISCNKK